MKKNGVKNFFVTSDIIKDFSALKKIQKSQNRIVTQES